MSLDETSGRIEVFCDTSVLISYVLDQNNVGAREILLDPEIEKVISEKVNEEFQRVPDRKDEIYFDFIDVVTSEDENISEQKAETRDYLKKNDIGFFETLREEITEGESKKEKMRILREVQKVADRRHGRVQEIVGEPYPQNDDMSLLFRLGQEIDNQDDCQVICDAVGWTLDGGEGKFATLDKHDLIYNEKRINKAIESKKGPQGTLKISPPDDYLAA